MNSVREQVGFDRKVKRQPWITKKMISKTEESKGLKKTATNYIEKQLRQRKRDGVSNGVECVTHKRHAHAPYVPSVQHTEIT